MPLTDIFDLEHHEVDVFDIGAPNLCLCFYAMATKVAAGAIHVAIVSDWRGVGIAAASERIITVGPKAGRTLGDVLSEGAGRSGISEVNAIRKRAKARLEANVGPQQARDTVRSITVEQVLAHDAEGVPDDAGSSSSWTVMRWAPGDEAPVVLAESTSTGPGAAAGTVPWRIES